MERLSTGIPGLDELVGGYPKEKSILISGAPGAGKTIMALHFVVASCDKGLTCTYLATEESPADIKSQAECFGWDLGEYEKTGELKLINVLERQVKAAKDSAKYGSPMEITTFMPFYNRIPAETDVVVLDNIGSLAVGMKPEVLRAQMDLLVYKLSEIGATSLIVSDEALSERTNDVVMYSVYGAIKLMRRENPFTNKRERVMDIIKLRTSKVPLEYILFDITSQGIKIISTTN